MVTYRATRTFNLNAATQILDGAETSGFGTAGYLIAAIDPTVTPATSKTVELPSVEIANLIKTGMIMEKSAFDAANKAANGG